MADGDKTEFDDAALAKFMKDLHRGIPFTKLTNKASKLVRRVLTVNSAESTLTYRSPQTDEEGKSGGVLCCGTGGQSQASRPTLTMAMLTKPKGADLGNGNFAIKVSAQSQKIKILCMDKKEYTYLLNGLTLLYEGKSSKETVGQMDPRNTSVGSLADIYKLTGYTPASFTMVKADGSKKTYNLCCGYSWEDMGYFTCFFTALWAFVLGFYGLLLKAALDTDEDHVALWFYFVFFVLGVSMITMSINVAQRTAAEKAAKAEEKAKEVEATV